MCTHNAQSDAQAQAGAGDLPLYRGAPVEPLKNPALLRRADQDAAKNHLRWSYPDLAKADFEGSALGIYVREVVCTVQSFTVEPIDN